MKTLIFDFLRRWWWVFAVAALISGGTAVAGVGCVAAPAAIVALLLDAQRGVFRVARPLPVSRRDQDRAWWIVGVPLLPLLSVPALAIGILVHQAIQPPGVGPAAPREAPVLFVERLPQRPSATPLPMTVQPASGPARSALERVEAPWFAGGVQLWMALGYTGLCFLVAQWLPTRPAERVAEHIQQGIAGGVWGISIPGVVLLLPLLPRTPAAIAPWHWVAFAAVPVVVVVSYFSAADVVQRRLAVAGVKARPPADPEAGVGTGRLDGVPLFVVNFAGRIMLLVAVIAVGQALTMRWIFGIKIPTHHPAIVLQVLMLSMMIAVLTAESVGMRALRVLPLSTWRLAVLMLLVPWAAGLACAAVIAFMWGLGDPALPVVLNFASQALSLCGWASLSLAVTLHISSSVRVFAMAAMGMLAAVPAMWAAHTTIVTAIGALAGILGFALLMRGLRRSSAFYRPRGFFGMGGIGQPASMR